MVKFPELSAISLPTDGHLNSMANRMLVDHIKTFNRDSRTYNPVLVEHVCSDGLRSFHRLKYKCLPTHDLRVYASIFYLCLKVSSFVAQCLLNLFRSHTRNHCHTSCAVGYGGGLIFETIMSCDQLKNA